MTPKSLLRLPARARRRSRSSPTAGFQRVIDDPTLPGTRDEVTRLVLCTGKIYYDIAGHEERDDGRRTSRSRASSCSTRSRESELVELIDELPEPRARSSGSRRSRRTWAPRAFMQPPDGEDPARAACRYDYVGRQLRAAPGEGYSAAHKREQARIVRVALDLEDDRLEPDSSAQRPVM